MYWLSIPIVGVLSVCYYRKKILNWIINKVLDNYAPIVPASHDIEISDTGKALIMTYTHMNETYKLLVPFNRRSVVNMSQYKVYLIKDDKSEIDITQQAGIPYLVDPSDLGCNTIIIKNLDNGLNHKYDKAPMYGLEVLDD